MAQQSLGATGQNSRHPTALDRERTVSDGVYALMKPVKRASRQSRFNHASSDSMLPELPARDHAVLVVGKLCQHLIDRRHPELVVARRIGASLPARAAFSVPWTENAGLVGHHSKVE